MSVMPIARNVTRMMADPAGEFYTDVLEELNRAGFQTLLGGTYALSHYTGTDRPTKDLDVFAEQTTTLRIVEHFATLGYDTEMTFSHWLAKIHRGPHYVDIIFSSGNGVARVDDRWFDHAVPHTVFGVPVRLSPPEEMIWSKAFVQERERYDGGDVIHLLYHCGRTMDWPRVIERFGPHWRVLFSFVVLYGFAYPSARERIPSWVSDDLLARYVMDATPVPTAKICNGTLISREQYLADIKTRGFIDPRLAPLGHMTSEELAAWTAAIGRQED